MLKAINTQKFTFTCYQKMHKAVYSRNFGSSTRNCTFDDLINIHQKIFLPTKIPPEKTVTMVTGVLLYEDNQVF